MEKDVREKLNLALRRNEIKDGMRIWDNKTKMWITIVYMGDDGFWHEIENEDGLYPFEFNENQYYRKEVKF